ncbi:MAG: signal recognition particle-docking protein FtsY [Pseudomonadota bacterium]|nr:signal recognition particle-docking protein FtsY [Pseudomonadota bacterium]
MSTDQISKITNAENNEGLFKSLSRSSAKLTSGITNLFSKKKLDKQSLDELEELLVSCDLGVSTASKIIGELAQERFSKDINLDDIKSYLAEKIALILEPVERPLKISTIDRPFVVLVCGVNGSGKTTTIAKLAKDWRGEGKSILLAAGDTFRAAAIDQLQIWGERTGCAVIASDIGGDPAGLVFDAMKHAENDRSDILLIDTAGRLQNKKDLMAELEKIVRVIQKSDKTAPHSVVLVMDATVGQNAHSQVNLFKESVDVSGLIITKLDGTAKGGVVVALADKFKIPVFALGVGEGLEDLRPFEAKKFARALVGLPI